jgi:hypothetical protein
MLPFFGSIGDALPDRIGDVGRAAWPGPSIAQSIDDGPGAAQLAQVG